MIDMDIKFLKIKFRNIREFDDLEISFLKEEGGIEPHHISLVQMPNGTGKTTTIRLMKYAMAGIKPPEDAINSFAPIDTDATDGDFELHMYAENQYHAIRLFFNYIESKCIIYTTRQEGGGRQKGYKLPHEIQHILTPDFTDLFIFDGELSKKLLDRKDSAAKHAIEVIYNLDKLSILNNKIAEIIDQEQQNKESGVKSDQGLAQQKKILKNLESDQESLEKQASELKECIEEKTELFGKYEEDKEKFFDKYENIKIERDKTKEMLDESLTCIKQNASDILNDIREPPQYSPYFHDGLNKLANNLIKLKLPKTISTEFFKELADSEQCICGEPIDEQHKQNILRNANQYLSEDDITVMNSVKDSIRKMGTFNKVDGLIEELSKNQRTFNTLNQKLNILSLDFNKPDQMKVDELNGKIDLLKAKIRDGEELLDIIETNDKAKIDDLSPDLNIYCCEREIEKLKKRIMEATNTVQFTKQAKRLQEINNKIREESSAEIKKLIINESNSKLKQLLNTDDIVINDIAPAITIKDKDGVSQGQSLAIAYAYLATLFDDSKHKIPFVIDSPAGALDIDVRREVSSIIPKLYDQLIIFILSSERKGFMEGIEKYTDIQYLTAYKDRTKKTIATDCSKNFFMNFQSEVNDGISNQ